MMEIQFGIPVPCIVFPSLVEVCISLLRERYRGGILLEENFTITYDSDLITESQTSINMSKLAPQTQTNDDDSEIQNQEDDNIITIEYGLDSYRSNTTQSSEVLISI